MKYIKENKGITLIALSITIVVIIILSSISLKMGYDVYYDSKDDKYITELKMVQHAVLEQYTKSKTINDDTLLYGEPITDLQDIETKIEVNLKSTEGYYKLDRENLKKIGISNSSDTYVVNYKTGEVLNYTQLKTPYSKEILYVSST